MSSELHFGNLSVSIFGESHGKGIGVVIQGLPGGCEIDFEKVDEAAQGAHSDRPAARYLPHIC